MARPPCRCLIIDALSDPRFFSSFPEFDKRQGQAIKVGAAMSNLETMTNMTLQLYSDFV
jgi:hypothetical protein